MRRLSLSNSTLPSTRANNVQSRPGADVLAGDELGAALADEDAAGGDELAAKSLSRRAVC